jgi:hypothetical protein
METPYLIHYGNLKDFNISIGEAKNVFSVITIKKEKKQNKVERSATQTPNKANIGASAMEH